jgi:hypothetical protein
MLERKGQRFGGAGGEVERKRACDVQRANNTFEKRSMQ